MSLIQANQVIGSRRSEKRGREEEKLHWLLTCVVVVVLMPCRLSRGETPTNADEVIEAWRTAKRPLLPFECRETAQDLAPTPIPPVTILLRWLDASHISVEAAASDRRQVLVGNEKYNFELVGPPSASESLSIKEVDLSDDDDRAFLLRLTTVCDPLEVLETDVLEAVQRGLFKIVGVTPSSDGSEVTVSLAPGTAKPIGGLHFLISGVMTCRADVGWLPTRGRYSTDVIKEGLMEVEQTNAYEKLPSSGAYRVRETHVTVTAKGKVGREFHSVIDSFTPNYQAPKSSFYLSHYGLPEPEGVTPPGRAAIPTWLWLTGVGLALIGLAFVLFRWARWSPPRSLRTT